MAKTRKQPSSLPAAPVAEAMQAADTSGESAPRPGRPAGAKNRDYATAVEIPVRCPACQSTNRAPYESGPYRSLEHGGRLSDGTPYTRIEWRNTRCLDCSQHIAVRRYVNG